MFGFGSSSPARGSDVHRAQQLVHDDDDEEDLAGVGIVFVRAPDDSLFVKSIIDGSGAQNSGIQVGDCLMKVEGKNVYCRGIEVATKLILGPVGTAVRLKFGRIDRGGKRHVYSQMLVRELKATSAPQWQINSANSMIEGITTSQLYLECMQNGSGSGSGSLTNQGENSLVATISRSMSAQAKVGSRASNTTSEDSSSYVSADGFENDDGVGVFGRGGFGGGSSCSSSSASRASKEEAGGDESTGESKKPKKQRKILFKGKWYTEDEISEMERVARSLTDKIEETLEKKVQNRAAMKGEKRSPPELSRAAANSAVSPAKDGGFKPKASVDQSPEALSAAIFVVHGGNLSKTSKSKLAGENRTVLVKMSTGGMITWGGKSAHVMRASLQKDAYDPKMTKAQYRDMDCKFAVVLEGDKFFAHSNDGGTVRAVEGRVLEFTADTPENCKRWVLGISAVLDMMKREAASRAAKARVIESAPSDARVKSVFITRPMVSAPTGDLAQYRSNSLPSLQLRPKGAASSSAISERDVAPVVERRHAPAAAAAAAARDAESPPLTAVSSSQASNVSTESSGRADDGRAGRIDVLRFLEGGKERENAALCGNLDRKGHDVGGSHDEHACEEEDGGSEKRKVEAEEEEQEKEREAEIWKEKEKENEAISRAAKMKEEKEAERRKAEEEDKEESSRAAKKQEAERRKVEIEEEDERSRAAKKKEEKEAERRKAEEEEMEERSRAAKKKEEEEAERKKAEESHVGKDGEGKEEKINVKPETPAKQSDVRTAASNDTGMGDGKLPGLAKALKSTKQTVTREAPEPSEIDKAIALKPAAKRDRVSDETRLAVQKNVVMAARARTGTDDLASLLAARKKKQQEAEENEDGYYFD